MRKFLWVLSLVSSLLWAETGRPSETHFFKVRAQLHYRCYGGYDKKKIIKDSRTGMICDNKEYRETLFNKVVPIKIEVQPTPDQDPTLAGQWNEKLKFKGRNFEVAISLFKIELKGRVSYRAQLAAKDDVPSAREGATLVEFNSPKQMNPVTVQFHSVGTPEEITFEVLFEPAG